MTVRLDNRPEYISGKVTIWGRNGASTSNTSNQPDVRSGAAKKLDVDKADTTHLSPGQHGIYEVKRCVDKGSCAKQHKCIKS